MKKTMAVLGAVALAVGAALAGGVSAQAHTGDLNASAVCNTITGQYDVTYSLTTSQTALSGKTMWDTGTTSFAGTPKSAAGLTLGPVNSVGAQTVVLGTIHLPGNSIQAPWAYAFTTWSNNFTKGSDGGDIGLAGTCTKTPPVDKPVTTETVVFAQHSCDVLGTVVAPVVEGVHYSEVVDGTVVGAVENFPAGSFFATDDGTATGAPFYGDITITASAEDGYTLSDGSVTVWVFTFVEPVGCEVVVVPPPSVPKPPVLAATGVNDVTGWLIPFGVGLFLLGGGLLLGRRRMFAGK